MTIHHYLHVQKILALLLLGNGSSSISGFGMGSKPKRGGGRGAATRFVSQQSVRSTATTTTPLLSPVVGAHPAKDSSDDYLYQGDGYSIFVTNVEEDNNNLELLQVPDEGTDNSNYCTYYCTSSFSQKHSVPNVLEYKDNRNPVDTDTTSSDDFVEAIRIRLKRKISMEEVYELAVEKNLPKKKTISLHSFISSMSVMASLVLLLPTFHPGLDDNFGLPQLFSYEYASYDLLRQSQLCALLQMVSSIMGVFRLPKRSPSVRTVGFVVSALIITQLSLVIMSSLNGTDVYLFDAFSMQGRILISVINTTLLKGSLDSLVLIVGDKERKGWDTVPNYGSKPSAFIAIFPFHILICITGNAVLPVLCDKQSFIENAVPFFAIFPGVQTLGYVAISLAVGLGALLATLQYEKKITNEFASFWNLFALVFLTFDGVKFMVLLTAFPERFAHSEYVTSYTPQLQSIWHTNECLGVGTILALMVGLKNLSSATVLATSTSSRNRNNKANDEAIMAVVAVESPNSKKQSPENALVLASSKYQDIVGDGDGDGDGDSDVEEQAHSILIDLELVTVANNNNSSTAYNQQQQQQQD